MNSSQLGQQIALIVPFETAPEVHKDELQSEFFSFDCQKFAHFGTLLASLKSAYCQQPNYLVSLKPYTFFVVSPLMT